MSRGAQDRAPRRRHAWTRSERALPVPGTDRWGGVVALGIVVFIITFVSLVVGELTPKALALRNPERAACPVARPIRAVVKLLAGPGRVLPGPRGHCWCSVSRLADGSYIIDGMTTVRDLRDRVGLDVPESPHDQTVAGLLLHELRTMPRPGMTVRVGGYAWTTVEMSGPRVAKVRVEALAG